MESKKRKDGNMNRRTFFKQGLAASILAGVGSAEASAFRQTGIAGSIVETTVGRVRGRSLSGVHIFKGIPYGASTESGARFMPPSRPKPWTGLRDAYELGIKAPQLPENLIPEVAAMRPKTEAMGEDCLCVNVWTAGPGSGRGRPVMVWLHGGGFAAGSGGAAYYDGSALARKHDVVVVTVNHRLNLFGFLYLAELGGEQFANSGNVGMQDIVAALQWVRDNIGAFGGDSRNVTIFGESGGGGKVATLLAMPAAKGLFHRAIIESSGTLRAIPRDRATETARMFLARLQLEPSQIDRLRGLPMERLLATLQDARGLQFSPVLDGRSLPTHQCDPVAPQISSDVPLIIGSNATEVTFQANTPLEPLDDAGLMTHVKQYVGAGDADAARLIAVYRNADPNADNLHVYHLLASDFWMRINVITYAERKAALRRAPAYMYYFDWRTPVRAGKLKTPHTLDIPFVFDNPDSARQLTGDGEERYALADKMSRAWVSFARTGNPNHAGLPSWPAYDANRRPTMVFNNACTVVNDPGREARLAMGPIRQRRE